MEINRFYNPSSWRQVTVGIHLRRRSMKNTLFLIAIGGLLWGAIAFAQKDASLKAGSDPKAEVKTEVVAMHALLMKLPKPASASVDPVSA